MSQEDWIPENSPVRVCGWGNTDAGGSSYPEELHCIDTKFISRESCNYNGFYNGEVMPGSICAGELGVGGKDACQESVLFIVCERNDLFCSRKFKYLNIQRAIPVDL